MENYPELYTTIHDIYTISYMYFKYIKYVFNYTFHSRATILLEQQHSLQSY
jgi:hypothetical protein